MMERLLRSLHVYYAGGVIMLALVLGGGTAQGLWTDHLLQIALLGLPPEKWSSLK